VRTIKSRICFGRLYLKEIYEDDGERPEDAPEDYPEFKFYFQEKLGFKFAEDDKGLYFI
jgi:hypothetical protein